MHTNGVNHRHALHRFANRFYIIFTWILGLFLGLHIIPLLTMQGGTFPTVIAPEPHCFPIWWLSSILPLLLAIIFARTNISFALPLLCLAKALLLGFSLFVLSRQFPSGTWLAALLLIFPDIVSGCLLLWLSLRQGVRMQARFLSDAAIILLTQAAAICFDLFFIAPFLQKLF